MSIKSCSHCGHQNSYLAIEPKFCSNCGKELSGSSSSSFSPSITKRQPTRPNAKLNEDETDVDFLPNIKKLEYDISPFEKNSVKFGELFNLDDKEKTG
jgi:hypothetical protein